MPFSHEGSTAKIEGVINQMNWKRGKRSRFHTWLGKAYPFEKDQMSPKRLLEAAQEFAQGDRDQRDD